MNIEKIRNTIENSKGKKKIFRFNGSRNQIEEFSGTIENVYNYIFLVKIDNDNESLRSFSYTDILTESLEIFEDK